MCGPQSPNMYGSSSLVLPYSSKRQLLLRMGLGPGPHFDSVAVIKYPD